MQTRAETDATQLTSIGSFRMILMFDSDLAQAEATNAADIILAEVDDQVQVEKSLFDTASLDFAETRERAIHDARAADVIIVALSSDRHALPLQTWTEQWLKQRNMDEGLLAFIPCGDLEFGSDLTEYLRETAVSANMDFISRRAKNRVV
jgi:hypothetical protein